MTTVSYEAQRAAHRRWRVRREQLIAAGQWQPFVDARPVRDHVNKIRSAGMPIWALEERLGMAAHHLDHLLWGSEGMPPGRTIRTETAEALLAFWPTLDDFPDSARIDSTGTRRRVHALETRGFNLVAMARHLGMGERYFQKATLAERVTARMARAVRALYDLWWDADPCAYDVKPWVADRTRRAADRKGFAGPLAWDDDTIDDPNAVPQTDAPEPVATEGGNVAARWLMGEAVVLDREARKEVVAHFYEWTQLSTEEIAAKVEMNPDAVDQIWHRIKKQARMEGRPVPRRRVYAYRDKDLTKNEMGEAA